MFIVIRISRDQCSMKSSFIFSDYIKSNIVMIRKQDKTSVIKLFLNFLKQFYMDMAVELFLSFDQNPCVSLKCYKEC